MGRGRRGGSVFVAAVIICHVSVEHFLANDFRRHDAASLTLEQKYKRERERERERGSLHARSVVFLLSRK